MEPVGNEVPPHDEKSEKSLLGAYLVDPSKLEDPACRVEKTDFYIPEHVAIYEGIVNALERGIKIDATTVFDVIKARDGRTEQEAFARAIELLAGLPHAEHAPYYATIVREKSLRRQTAIGAREVARLALNGEFDPELIRAALDKIPDPVDGPRRQRIAYRTLADVSPCNVHWLWPGRIPLGKLTLLAGDPGLGKSFMTIDIAARVSRGMPWPDDEIYAPPPGDVILMSAEDDPADTIRPRLDEAAGDPRRVHVVDGIAASAKRQERPRSFCIETDLPLLDSMLDEFPETRLVVIDPVSAYGNGATDTHKNSDVRAQLAALEKLAQDRHVAVLVVSHLNKSGAGKAVYRVSGSLAYTAAARIAWLVASDRADEKRRLVVQIKNNLAPDPGGLAFAIEAGRLEWESGTIDMRADDLVVSDKGEDDMSGRDEAEEFLKGYLAEGEQDSRDVKRDSRAEGISEKSLRTARGRICKEPRREGFGKDMRSYWSLLDDIKDSLPDSQSCPSRAIRAQSQGEGTNGTTGQDWPADGSADPDEQLPEAL